MRHFARQIRNYMKNGLRDRENQWHNTQVIFYDNLYPPPPFLTPSSAVSTFEHRTDETSLGTHLSRKNYTDIALFDYWNFETSALAGALICQLESKR